MYTCKLDLQQKKIMNVKKQKTLTKILLVMKITKMFVQ